MNIGAILGIISQIPKLVEAISDVVDSAKGVLSEDDLTTLKDALATLQSQNNVAYDRIQVKLSEASKRS